MDAINTVVASLEKANQAQDDRLSVLYGVKAGTEINDIVRQHWGQLRHGWFDRR